MRADNYWSADDVGSEAGRNTAEPRDDVSGDAVSAQTADVAKKTTVTLIDDLDPEQPADETVQFSLDGTSYEIDLSTEHADELRDSLASYVGAGRRAGGTRSVRRAPRTSSKPSTPTAELTSSSAPGAVDTKAVREWAKAHGKPVNERGRIASSLLIEFQKAHHD